MPRFFGPLHGRGTGDAPGNRFERLHVEDDAETWAELAANDPDFEPPSPKTTFYRDDSQSIISTNTSPDIGFDASLNPYRGCEHGCAYCYARPYHEYLGFNAGIDFESKIMVKENAAILLEKALAHPRWKPTSLACSGVTDPYQPIERDRQITRSCLEVLNRLRHPVGIITKNHVVTRDADLLGSLAGDRAAAVYLSITTLDTNLGRVLEPRASTPVSRLRAVRTLTEAGIPVGVSVAPIIPGLNDHEIPAILEAAAEHGAISAGYTLVRLPHGVKDVFRHWLEEHRPGEADKILNRIREMRGGSLNAAGFGERMTGTGSGAEQLKSLFQVAARRAGLDRPMPKLSSAAFRRPTEQLKLDFS